MKKVLIFAMMMTLAGVANAGLWDSVATSGWPEVTPETKYKLDVYGFDARVYEYRPKGNPDILCIATFTGGNTNTFQQDCILSPKK